MPIGHYQTTADGLYQKQDRVIQALKKPANWDRSNRDLAKELRVDESTVRKYRADMKVPKLAVGTGLPAATKRRRKKRR